MSNGENFIIRNSMICIAQGTLGINSRTQRWASHVARMEDSRNTFKKFDLKAHKQNGSKKA